MSTENIPTGGTAEGTSTATPPPASPAEVKTAAEPPKAPATIPVPADQFNELMKLHGIVAQYEEQRKAAERDAQEKLVQAQIAKGQAEAAVSTVRTQLEKERDDEKTARAVEAQRARTFVRDSALAQAAVGLDFVSQAAGKDFLDILKPKLEAHAKGDSYEVRTEAFQTPEQLIEAAKVDPRYAHFFKPTTQGGAGSGGTPKAPAAPQKPEAEAKLFASILARNTPANSIAAGGMAPYQRN